MYINIVERNTVPSATDRPAPKKKQSDHSFSDTMESLFTADAVELTSSAGDQEKRKNEQQQQKQQERAVEIALSAGELDIKV